MARPRKEGLDYFPHDVNLSTDKKVEALRILHGNDGYTFFCIMLENIYQEDNFELNVSDAETIQIFARKVEVTVQKFEEMIKTAIKHGCFDKEMYEEHRILTSKGIKKRASVVTEKREKMRKSYGNTSKEVSGEVSDAETREETTQSKVKEKESKSKEKECMHFEEMPHIKIKIIEYKKLIELIGNEETVMDYIYKFASWVLNQPERKQKTSSTYLSIRNWHKRDLENKKNIVQFKPTRIPVTQEYVPTPEDLRREERMKIAYDV